MVSVLLLQLNFQPLPLHHTMVSILLIYLHFPPNVPPYNDLRFISLFELSFPSAPPYNGFHLLLCFNPCAPPNNGLHSTSIQLPLHALHHIMVSVSLLQLNFHPLPLHTMVSIFSLKLPSLRSTMQWSPLYFFI